MQMGQAWAFVTYGGRWIKDSYVGGVRRLILIPPTGLLYVDLLSKIQTMVGADVNNFSYGISSIVELPKGDNVTMDVMNDVDLKFVTDICESPKFFITVNPILPSKPVDFMHLPKDQDALLHNPAAPESMHGGNNVSNNAPVCNDDDISEDQANYDSLDDDDLVGVSVGVGVDLSDSSVAGSLTIRRSQTQNIDVRQWTIPGALYQASLHVDVSTDFKSCSRDPLTLGSTFSDKECMVIALGLYHLTNRVEYVVDRSTTTRFSVKCKYPDQCNFIMRATQVGTIWRVIKWNVPHTCYMDFRCHGPRTLSSKVVGAFFTPDLMYDGAVLKPKEMASKLRREYGFQVDYSIALAGRNHAINMIYGDADKSFQLLPSYLHMVQHSNPGSIVDLETDSEDRFRYAFMALGASINGFLSAGRPVIVLDATHLKGKYRGVMFVAASMDGNEQIFPLAFGLGDKENDSSWTWFLRHLKSTFDWPNDLLFVSDQHLSITNAIQCVYPGVPHGLCVFHLQKNL